MSFKDYSTAAKMRDLIRRIVADELEKLRPGYRYGTVVSVDTVAHRCQVQFPGETATSSISLGSVTPSAGAIVRVAGIVGDRYVDDVMP